MKFQLAINLERLDDGDDMRDVAAHLVETLATPARAGTTAEIWTQTEEEAAEQRLALLGGDPWKLAPPIKRKPKWKQMEEAEGGA